MEHLVSKLLLTKFQAFAAGPTPTPLQLGVFQGIGRLGGDPYELTSKENAIGTFATILTNAIGIMTIIAFIWFLFLLIIGAISYMTAGGDKVKTQNAGKQITGGLIGLVIVVLAIFLIRLVGTLLGIPFLDIYSLIINLKF